MVDWRNGSAHAVLATARRVGFEALPTWNEVNGATGEFSLEPTDVAFILSARDRDLGLLVASKPGSSRLAKCVKVTPANCLNGQTFGCGMHESAFAVRSLTGSRACKAYCRPTEWRTSTKSPSSILLLTLFCS